MKREAVAHEVTESDLQEMLAAYAGPEHPQADMNARRTRRLTVPILIASALLAGVSAVAAVQLASDGSSEGALDKITATPARLIPFNVPIDEMIATSDAIFVGKVVAIDGPEVLAAANPPEYPDPTLAYSVSFEVKDLFSGEVDSRVRVTNTIGRGPLFSAEVGETYLVFAAWNNVGPERVRRLTLVGLDQGIFHVVDPHRAVNSRLVSVDPEAIANKVNELPAPGEGTASTGG